MGGIDRATLRAAALHLDRHRARIELEVNRRLGRASPPPDAREELIRRLRSYARLASVDWNAARPSFDGFAGYSARALERTVQTTVETAGEFSDEPAIREALREIGERFRSGIRRVFIPKDDDGSKKKRKKRANAGKRVRAAIDRISDAYIALCLETGTVYDLNPAAETLFGGDSKALLKRPLQKLVRPEDRVQYQDLGSGPGGTLRGQSHDLRSAPGNLLGARAHRILAAGLLDADDVVRRDPLHQHSERSIHVSAIARLERQHGPVVLVGHTRVAPEA